MVLEVPGRVERQQGTCSLADFGFAPFLGPKTWHFRHCCILKMKKLRLWGRRGEVMQLKPNAMSSKPLSNDQHVTTDKIPSVYRVSIDPSRPECALELDVTGFHGL